jgi:hypothetical protein
MPQRIADASAKVVRSFYPLPRLPSALAFARPFAPKGVSYVGDLKSRSEIFFKARRSRRVDNPLNVQVLQSSR